MMERNIDNLLNKIPKENRYMVTAADLINYCYSLEERIEKAVEELELWQPKIESLKLEKEYLLNILNGEE